MGGEDFSYFAQVVPGFYFRLGVANEEKGITYGGHTPMYDCDEESDQNRRGRDGGGGL
jgi:metal-dependent amidase/aminoacylase/carboxypeptidase family protein